MIKTNFFSLQASHELSFCLVTPGMSSRGPQRFTPPKQRAHMALVAHVAALAMNGRPPLEGPLEMEIAAEYIKPKSWSRRKAAATKWKTSPPDVDNLAKIIKDTLSGIVYADDAQIALLLAKKRYADTATMIVTIVNLEGE